MTLSHRKTCVTCGPIKGYFWDLCGGKIDDFKFQIMVLIGGMYVVVFQRTKKTFFVKKLIEEYLQHRRVFTLAIPINFPAHMAY